VEIVFKWIPTMGKKYSGIILVVVVFGMIPNPYYSWNC
jgi:hypothetical protein